MEDIITKFNYLENIIIYSLIAFFASFILYPLYINFLKKLKAWAMIREDTTWGGSAEIYSKLHSHKVWTPTMWGGLILLIVALLVLFSYVLQYAGVISFTLVEREETYILLFAFFSMWILGLLDDFTEIKGKGALKWLTAKMKLVWMFGFAGFIAFWFYDRLWVSTVDLRPIAASLDFGLFFPVIAFFITLAIVNAINITDWLDWLVGGLSVIVLFVLWILTFFYGWYLATTLIWIVLGATLAFLRFNINPAKVFLGDSWSLALWGIVSALVFLLNINVGIVIPFAILFGIFILEVTTSFLQITWKRLLGKKLFPIAPFHHWLEYKWNPEYSIVMKLWVIQWVLAWITLVMIFYQFHII